MLNADYLSDAIRNRSCVKMTEEEQKIFHQRALIEHAIEDAFSCRRFVGETTILKDGKDVEANYIQLSFGPDDSIRKNLTERGFSFKENFYVKGDYVFYICWPK